MAGGRQRLDRGPEHRAVKALMLGMREDDQNLHGPWSSIAPLRNDAPRVYFSMPANVLAKVWTSPGHRAET
jgi:hypothetical protein